jgi:glycosyltransferase involved in cell wall biosynthesis
MNPKVSIIIPTLNRPKALIELLKRISRIIDNEEIIVVDDSSKSQERQIKELISNQIVYINRGEKLGVSSARNVGAKMAKGEYLLFLDDDDDFLEDWINDFKSKTSSNTDLIYCDMITISPTGTKSVIKNFGKNRSTVIPGSWMIKKSLYLNVGGFDERLKFGENTELFFRIDRKHPTVSFIQKSNFIYKPSIDGGSKSLKNAIDSNLIVLEKHGDLLSNHIKHLYHQVIGVNFIRFRKFREAQYHLWIAYKLKPRKISTLIRFLISILPFLAKSIYSKEVKI